MQPVNFDLPAVLDIQGKVKSLSIASQRHPWILTAAAVNGQQRNDEPMVSNRPKSLPATTSNVARLPLAGAVVARIHWSDMRYLVVGTSGAGKSTFAGKLAAATRCPHIELDSHYWGPDWKAVPPEQFKRSVAAATQGTCWVADGNYSAVRGVLWSRATHVVWLNYGRFTVFSRLLWRTLSRGIARTRLSHGNRESLRMAFFSRDSILLWSLSTYAKNQEKFAALRGGDEFAHLQWTEITEPSRATAFLKDAAASSCR